MIKVAPGNTEFQKYSDTENRLNRKAVGAQGRTKGNALVANLRCRRRSRRNERKTTLGSDRKGHEACTGWR